MQSLVRGISVNIHCIYVDQNKLLIQTCDLVLKQTPAALVLPT